MVSMTVSSECVFFNWFSFEGSSRDEERVGQADCGGGTGESGVGEREREYTVGKRIIISAAESEDGVGAWFERRASCRTAVQTPKTS